MISYSLPEAANVSIQIYDLSGAQIAGLPVGLKMLGNHQLQVDLNGPGLSQLNSGLYFYRLTAVLQGDHSQIFTTTRRMTILK